MPRSTSPKYKKVRKPQFLEHGLTFTDYEKTSKEEIAATIEKINKDVERRYPDYKFSKLFYDFPENKGNIMHCRMKFILKK